MAEGEAGFWYEFTKGFADVVEDANHLKTFLFSFEAILFQLYPSMQAVKVAGSIRCTVFTFDA